MALLHSRSVKAIRLHLPSLAWLALVAMLALALLPTVARAMASAPGDGSVWAEICTAQGMKRVALNGQPGVPTVPVSASSHLDHCPFCTLSAQALDLPPVPNPVQDAPAAADSPPGLYQQAPREPFAWHRGQPRAPPLST